MVWIFFFFFPKIDIQPKALFASRSAGTSQGLFRKTSGSVTTAGKDLQIISNFPFEAKSSQPSAGQGYTFAFTASRARSGCVQSAYRGQILPLAYTCGLGDGNVTPAQPGDASATATSCDSCRGDAARCAETENRMKMVRFREDPEPFKIPLVITAAHPLAPQGINAHLRGNDFTDVFLSEMFCALCK